MTDSELWYLAVAEIRQEVESLDPIQFVRVKAGAAAIAAAKRALFAVAEKVDSAAVCAACKGECCLAGKYHVTLLDIITMLADDQKLPEPDFGAGHCPYLGEQGCLMPAAYRPYNCLIFHCERVEGLLEPLALQELFDRERDLRNLYQQFEVLYGRRLWVGLMHVAESVDSSGPATSLRRV